MDDKEIKKLIRNELDNLNINQSFKGYKLLEEAIFFLVIQDKFGNSNHIFMKDIYEHIKRKHKTTYGKAERNMRYVLDDLRRRKAIKHQENKKITLSSFVYGLSYTVQSKI